MNVLIREWAPSDFQAIKEICRKTGQFTPFFGESHYRKMIEWSKKRLRWWLDPLFGYEQLVAEVDGRVVGVTFAFRELVIGGIALLAVHPEYQGRGIGSMLLEEVCGRLKRKNARLLNLMLDLHAKGERRVKLIRFYGRHGFKVLGAICIKKF